MFGDVLLSPSGACDGTVHASLPATALLSRLRSNWRLDLLQFVCCVVTCFGQLRGYVIV